MARIRSSATTRTPVAPASPASMDCDPWTQSDTLGGESARRTEDLSDTAAYISQISSELRRMASGSKFDTLVYLLSMVEVEAETLARQYREFE